MEGDTVVLQDIFTFDFSAGTDAEGRFLGAQKFTGIRPRFIDKFEEYSINYSPETFMSAMGGVTR